MSATAPGLASANFTESGAYRRTNVFSLATIMSGLVPSMVRVLMVTSPALASTAVTRPPTPRFCHSAWSACCFLAMSALVITTRVSHTTAAQRKSLIFITEETPNCKDVGEGGQGYGGGGKMLIGKPLSRSPRQSIPQPEHRPA